MSEADGGFTIQPASIDQLAGSVALILGALGSLLLVIWQSRCLCRCRIGISDTCYLFDCTREPPPLVDAEPPPLVDADVEQPGTDEQLFPPLAKEDAKHPESEPEPESMIIQGPVSP